MPLLIGTLRQRRGTSKVGRSMAIAEGDRGVAWAEEGGILAVDAAVAARRDVDVAGQWIVTVAEQLGADGAEVRPFHGRLLSPAGVHDVSALAVVVLGGVEAANQGEVVHLLRGVRQEFADMNAGH